MILLSINAIVMTVVFDCKKRGETSALCDIIKAVDSSAFSQCHRDYVVGQTKKCVFNTCMITERIV